MFYKGEIVLDRNAINKLQIITFTIIEGSDKILVVKDINGNIFNIDNKAIIRISDSIILFKKELFKQSKLLNKIDKFIEDLSVLKEKNIQLIKERLENKNDNTSI